LAIEGAVKGGKEVIFAILATAERAVPGFIVPLLRVLIDNVITGASAVPRRRAMWPSRGVSRLRRWQRLLWAGTVAKDITEDLVAAQADEVDDAIPCVAAFFPRTVQAVWEEPCAKDVIGEDVELLVCGRWIIGCFAKHLQGITAIGDLDFPFTFQALSPIPTRSAGCHRLASSAATYR
jgi:hypothetical protein